MSYLKTAIIEIIFLFLNQCPLLKHIYVVRFTH